MQILPQHEGITPISKDYYLVSVNDEVLQIPLRIYFDQTISRGKMEYGLTDIQQLILDCIYTRHHDGYVRQERLERLIYSDQDWVVPFKIQLLGEYVFEIIKVLNENINEKNISLYQNFILENKEYWCKTKDRVISYWNVYYKQHFPERSGYPGFQIIKKLN